MIIMIKEVSFIGRDGDLCSVNLRVGEDPFKNDIEYNVCNQGVVGVSWVGGNEIFVVEKKSSVFAYPTPDLSKMIVICSDEEIKAPDNAVVLNADGSRYCQLKIPERLSSANDRRLHSGKLTGFMSAFWSEKSGFMEIDCYIGESDFIETWRLNVIDFTFDKSWFKTWRL